MPGPAPKHPSTRARSNKSASAATISKPTKVKVPALPERSVVIDGETLPVPWHQMTVEWWQDVWASPMSPEWDDSDVHNVYFCALIVDDIWTAPTAGDRQKAASEYRLQRKDLGLTPFDRRRLEWQIESTDEAKERGSQRRSRQATAKPPVKGKADPRSVLSIVG